MSNSNKKLVFKGLYIGVDPAVSENTKNDCTAIVAGMVFAEKVGKLWRNKVYILPNPVNKRMNFCDAIQKIIDTHAELKRIYNVPDYKITVLIENAGQQKAFYDQLISTAPFSAKNIKLVSTKGEDKRSRIARAGSYAPYERVVFARIGCELLIRQLIGFGSEKHDDLADAFAMVVNYGMSVPHNEMGLAVTGKHGVYIIDPDDPRKKPNEFFAHGRWHYGNEKEYYKKIEEFRKKGLI